MKINTLTINGNTFEIADPAVEELSQTVSRLNEVSTNTSEAVKQLQDDSDSVWQNIDQLVEEQQNCVMTVKQTLTGEQKAQARANIGAMQDGVASGDLNMSGHQIKDVSCIEFERDDDADSMPGVVRVYVSKDEYHDELGRKCGVLEFSGVEDEDNPTILRMLAPGVDKSDAVTVGQLNAVVGDIETALDSIIAIQENLIGGAAE